MKKILKVFCTIVISIAFGFGITRFIMDIPFNTSDFWMSLVGFSAFCCLLLASIPGNPLFDFDDV